MNGITWFRIKTPVGDLVVEAKGAFSEYPGIFISFDKDGDNRGDIVACVEYDTCSGEIKTESYCKEYDEPVAIISYEDGHDALS